ncbi:hypothetical protein LPN04_30960 [Rugamonas sp. A1-17]|nr:hypothetical protein [Rugamonas sp. A1-17]
MKMQFKKIEKKKLWAIVALVSLISAIVGGKLVMLFALPVAFFAMVRLNNEFACERNLKVKRDTHKLLDHEMAGLRFLGSEVAVLASRRTDDQTMPGPLTYEQLCKTNRGTTFKLTFETRHGSGRASNVQIRPISQTEAEEWLERDRIEQEHSRGTLELA